MPHLKTITFHTYCTSHRSYVTELEDEFHKMSIQRYEPNDVLSDIAILVCDNNLPKEELHQIIASIKLQCSRIMAIYLSDEKLPYYQTCALHSIGINEIYFKQPIQKLIEQVTARLNRWKQVEQVVNSDKVSRLLIGQDTSFKETIRHIVEIAMYSNASLLIQGESGTGKELAAKLVHEIDRRPDKQELVLLDCTTIHPELSGSEFFGHEKGAFTNALSTRDGAFSLADRGTLFLDELGELPMPLQAELLRVIQDGIYKRVGSNTWKKTSFRMVCATNRNLKNEVEKGNFRQDLFYRISSNVITMPPLRQRKLDIPLLAEGFLKQLMNTDSPPPFSTYVLHYLLTQDFPGNVRELRQLMAAVAIKHTGKGEITLGDLPNNEWSSYHTDQESWYKYGVSDALQKAVFNGVGLKEIKRVTAQIAMEIAIKTSNGNLQEAARRLDVSDRMLQSFQANKRFEDC